jgi:hypothetical protein
VAQDDTVGFGYFSLLESVGGEVPAPDIVVSSLSKVFSGVGNAMGGALTLNAMSPNYGELKALMDEQFELMLAEADAGKCDLEAIFTSFDRLQRRRRWEGRAEHRPSGWWWCGARSDVAAQRLRSAATVGGGVGERNSTGGVAAGSASGGGARTLHSEETPK